MVIFPETTKRNWAPSVSPRLQVHLHTPQRSWRQGMPKLAFSGVTTQYYESCQVPHSGSPAACSVEMGPAWEPTFLMGQAQKLRFTAVNAKQTLIWYWYLNNLSISWVVGTGTVCPEEMWTSHVWRCSRPSWMQLWTAWNNSAGCLCLWQRAGSIQSLKSLPIQIILWF